MVGCVLLLGCAVGCPFAVPEYVREKAEEGESSFQYLLGLYSAHGIGVPQDEAEAIKWFREAEAQGSASAQFMLGMCFLDGVGVPPDKVEAMTLFRRSAESLENMDRVDRVEFVHFQLFEFPGWIEISSSIPEDKAEAVLWFRTEAEQGNALWQFSLGVRYANGRQGVMKDREEAAKWFHKAAEQNFILAQVVLGRCYLDGLGVSQNEAEAIKWFRKAAETIISDAQFNVGACYINSSVHIDSPGVGDENIRLIRQAAESGHPGARFILGICYLSGEYGFKDEAKGVALIRQAAGDRAYNVMPQYVLGIFYLDGIYVSQDAEEGIKWLCKSADQDGPILYDAYLPYLPDGHSSYLVGMCYLEGRGVPKDEVEAVKWLCKSVVAEEWWGQEWWDKEWWQDISRWDIRNEMKITPKSVDEDDDIHKLRFTSPHVEKRIRKTSVSGALMLAKCYLEGRGITKNEVETIKWLRIVVEQEEDVDKKIKLLRENETAERLKWLPKELTKWFREEAEKELERVQEAKRLLSELGY